MSMSIENCTLMTRRKREAGIPAMHFRFSLAARRERSDRSAASAAWIEPLGDWKAALNQFIILFGDRVPV